MTLTDRSKKAATIVIWLALAMILLLLTASPKGSQWMKAVGIPTKAISFIQIISIALVIVLIAVLAFLLAPLLGGLMAIILSIFGVVLLLGAVIYVYQALTSKITVKTNGSGQESASNSSGATSNVSPDASTYS